MKAVICDFDGTLLKKHSFPMWVFYIVRCSFKKGDIPVFFRFSSALALRWAGVISSSQFKTFLMRKSYPVEYDTLFVESLKVHVNPLVVERISEIDGYHVLSSASPLSYLEHVAEAFNVKFDKVLGSYVCGGVLFENYAENKVLALHEVIDFADDVVLFTDHHMDLPLMKISDEVFLVNPSKKTLRKADFEGVRYRVIEG
ncbi:phosphoserine phosphatase [Halomonas campaniensis]|uniref:Phosphoserine phosphatase n=1 Tax=Halomonas campaniensis TaxID=213554 RepID=A0A7W5PAM3_9GAMM|nr:HAD family hydrolase [Halomonas campaniensis]MBB3330949.1 phosphoserine phosphatase [Halomonas campaniensis]